MPRVARNALPDGYFHVTVRGVARMTIFRDDFDFATFRRQLLRIAERYNWTLHSYCLMPNHYHLIVQATREDLSKGMHRLNGGYAQGFNARYERAGHVFQNRFKSHVIEEEEHFERALAYVQANPVAAGLCEDGADWPWKD
jgi:REP element-mobilizing transposase RayT